MQPAQTAPTARPTVPARRPARRVTHPSDHSGAGYPAAAETLQSKVKLRALKASGLSNGLAPVLSCWPSTLPPNSVP